MQNGGNSSERQGATTPFSCGCFTARSPMDRWLALWLVIQEEWDAFTAGLNNNVMGHKRLSF